MRLVRTALYSALLRLATPAYLARLWWRGRREPLYRHALLERLAFTLPPMPRGGIWVHAVSLGETRWPEGPGSGGSKTAPSIGPAARHGAWLARNKLLELASAKPFPRASRVEIVEPKKNAKGDLKKAETWGIQVGAFRSKADAKEQLYLIEKRFGRHVDDAKGGTAKAGGKYAARFAGMSESEAKQACKAIKAKRLACAVADPRPVRTGNRSGRNYRSVRVVRPARGLLASGACFATTTNCPKTTPS